MNKEIDEVINKLKEEISRVNKINELTGTYVPIKILETVLNYIKELEEEKRITELTKISCCIAQNCGALENAIREGLENNNLRKQLADSIPKSVIRELISTKFKAVFEGNTEIADDATIMNIVKYVKVEDIEEILKEGEK